ncbi:tRNA (adenosine(37)-N6)-threonylcarbamoyltransferase complex dimerization subunit type 1 TsaB [Martelella alba]|uniref:tRNA (Adenosine(37)-N6)-threonylcarbamoyltransferase complex dimerization subunit type 1 TsaB n=1 Tax=Martelella alba TaxID=2590451 RepID=A0A506UB04_9HYPH|nr:tRNA (adenosine(37)-N6)-threonylcarbamoyltransferase complex dimerization subunit type 1 TsaB [Martelella alba]TPW30125.1 tRNA (adenosine(37)-N6)-threonylcarbamoyltransferase complex dimerization subunit type 1 TsaB [Martelella alba]
MIILAIETAGADCAACLFDSNGERLLAAVSETIGKGHAERLMTMIDEVVQASGLPLSAVNRIAVNIGPGSFTGIRVGVATARALALALDVECVGVTTLDVFARQSHSQTAGRNVLITMDAKRGEAYCALYDGKGHLRLAPAAYAYDALAGLAGEHDAVIAGSGGIAAGLDHIVPLAGVRVETIAALAAEMAAGNAVSPLYLRAPDAKPQGGFKVARA